jgi:hypothetical protein
LAKELGTVHTLGRGYLEGDGGSRPEVTFGPDFSTSPGNYGWNFVMYGRKQKFPLINYFTYSSHNKENINMFII